MKRRPNKPTQYQCGCGREFALARKLSPKQTPACPACRRKAMNAKARETQWHKKPEYQAKARERRVNQYGITQADYEQMVAQQNGVCAICKKSEPRGNLAIDHNHSTNAIRGLLCHKCNQAIGLLSDDNQRMAAAIAYLRRDNRGSWDEYFVDFARLAASRSKDRSSQVGAILVRDKTILSTGYNGFPRGVDDNRPERHERPAKYIWTIHAEENAILNAARLGVSAEGADIYVTPFHPCSSCAKAIVMAGVKTVIVDQQQENPRYAEEFKNAAEILKQCGVVVRSPE